MSKLRLILVIVGVVGLVALSSPFLTPKEQKLFAFYLPWDDSTETIVNLSDRLDKPAGSLGHVHVGEDGHLYIGGKRIRFLGVNICGGAAFPKKEDAEKIAARLAKFGVNIVRFHHMDASWEAFNIFDKTVGGTRHLNKEALDRLDYFIAKLKENGIYIDLNLLVSRRLTAVDGLPNEINTVDWKDQQVLGFFVDEIKELQKEYARQLLTHRNLYTELTYGKDPAVAFVEIVNEQGLIHGWLGGVIDHLADVFEHRLTAKWNEHLEEKYGSTRKLQEAWGIVTVIPQLELLRNGNFEDELTGWNTETHSGAQASYRVLAGPGGTNVLEVDVTKQGSTGWHVQFNYPGPQVIAEETYLVTFSAKADRQASVTVSLRQAQNPWDVLSGSVTVELAPEWRQYELALIASASETNARLDISNLGVTTATYQFASFSMRPFKGYSVKEGESIEASTIPIFTLGEFGTRTINARRDWVDFLWALEGYFSEMYRYIKDELKGESLVLGTIVGCSTPNIMAKLDSVDTHAYWHHPSFPGGAWDPNNWYVVNEPLVNYLNQSVVPWLSLKRVYGKPHLVSEYNNPAPNMYDAETVLTLATYAALQDWDGIFIFDYGSRDNWDTKRIRGYFDIDQHPIKMATMIPAQMLFVRGDLKPANHLISAELSGEREKELIAKGKARAWNLPDGSYLGIQSATPLVHRTALIVEGYVQPADRLSSQEVSIAGSLYRSDTGEIVWDITNRDNGVLLVNTSRSAVVLGFGAGKTFDLGSIVIAPEKTLLDGFSAITLSVIKGESFAQWNTLLLVVAGYTANTNMRVSEYQSGTLIAVATPSLTEMRRFNGGITCAGNWGEHPTLTEGVPVTVKIRISSDIVVWALDNSGKRVRQIPVSVEGNYRVFSVGPEYRTIWYEIRLGG